MDRFLTFDKHVDNMCSKANGLLYFLNRQKHLLDKKSRICVVEALINNIFSYCSIIWGSCNGNLIKKIQKVQNFAAKVADGHGKKFERATPYIKKLNWLKINEKIQYDLLVFLFKVIHNKLPDWIVTLPIVSQYQRRETRQAGNLQIPRTRTVLADKSLSVKGAKAWNDLPREIKIITKPSKFKRQLKQHFMQN